MSEKPPLPPLKPSRKPVDLPEDVILQWLSIPADQQVSASLTRTEWDDLFLGLISTTTALAGLRNSIAALAIGNQALAVEQTNRSTDNMDDATDQTRQFIRAFMSRASANNG